MELNDIDYPLPSQLSELLKVLVDVAERNQILVISYIPNQSTHRRESFDYVIRDYSNQDIIVEDLQGNPMESLQMLGLIERTSKNSVFLYPVAFERAKYERKGWFGKWWTKWVWLRLERAALIVVGFATFVLVTLQISQLIHSIWLWLNSTSP